MPASRCNSQGSVSAATRLSSTASRVHSSGEDGFVAEPPDSAEIQFPVLANQVVAATPSTKAVGSGSDCVELVSR